jgi:hypothetical protein
MLQNIPAGHGIFVDGFGHEKPFGHTPGSDDQVSQNCEPLHAMGIRVEFGQTEPSGQMIFVELFGQ